MSLSPADFIAQSFKDTTKVVINVNYGGFMVSKGFVEFCKTDDRHAYLFLDVQSRDAVHRSDPLFISLLEMYGLTQAADSHSIFKIVEVPKFLEECFFIDDRHGFEKISYTTKSILTKIVKTSKELDLMSEEIIDLIERCHSFL